MTPVRLAVLVGAAAAIAAAGAGVLLPHRPGPGAPEPAASAPAASVPVPSAPAPVPAATVTPIPAASPPPQARESVPPGILSRAADARALDRAPACTPAPARDQSCAPAQRDDVEVQWDVGREP